MSASSECKSGTPKRALRPNEPYSSSLFISDADIGPAVGVAHVLEIDRQLEVARHRLAVILGGNEVFLIHHIEQEPTTPAVCRRLGDDLFVRHFSLRIDMHLDDDGRMGAGLEMVFVAHGRKFFSGKARRYRSSAVARSSTCVAILSVSAVASVTAIVGWPLEMRKSTVPPIMTVVGFPSTVAGMKSPCRSAKSTALPKCSSFLP